MPANLTYDFLINGLGFMLARDPQSKGRAWVRTGVSDSLSSQRRVVRSIYSRDEEYGGLPDELDHPEVHDDWSGGCGDYYHHAGRDNHFHAGYNIDTRFPGMWFHAQQPQLLAGGVAGSTGGACASFNTQANFVLDTPLVGVDRPPTGAGSVLVLGNGYIAHLTPTPFYQYTNPAVVGNASAFDYSLQTDVGVAHGGRPAVFGSFVYIPVLSPTLNTIERDNFGGVFDTSVPLPGQWLQTAAGRLWRGSGQFVQSCALGADPTITANWSATLSIGNGQMASSDAVSLEDRLFIGFPDGLYMGDQTGTFSNVATMIGANVNADNCRDLTVHNGHVVFAEAGHVWGYTPTSGGGVLRDLWPQVDLRPLATLGNATNGPLVTKGTVRCLEGFGRWLYAGMFNGSQSLVYCGYEASGPDLPYVWHPMQLLAGSDGVAHATEISRLHVDAITAASSGAAIPRRMWAVTDASFGAQTGCTAPIYYWPIPPDDGPPFADSSFSAFYCNQARLEEGQRDWDAPGTWKVWRKLEGYIASMASLNVGIPLSARMIVDGTMLAGLDNGGNFFASGPPKDFHYFTNANSTAVGQAGQLTYLSQIGVAGQVNPTPVYRAFIERGNVRPRTADVISAKVRIADVVQDRQGGDMRPGAVMLNDLRTFALSSNPYPLVDLTGAVLPILVIPPVEEQEAYQGGSDNPEIVATIKMAVLDASWPTTNQTPLHPRGG